MIPRLIAHAVDRRVASIVVTLAIAAYGVYAYTETPIEAFPDVTNLQVTVIAQYHGYAPEEVERQVTVPLERALNGTPRMLTLRSESLYGLALVTLTFEDGADTFVARTLVDQRIGEAELPDVVTPFLAPEATPLGEVFQFRVISDRHDLYQLRSEMEFGISRHLKRIPGVADVVAFGGFLKELVVEVDPARLRQVGLTLNDVVEAVRSANVNVGGGILEQGEQEFTVRALGAMTSAEDVRAVVLRARDGVPVTVADVITRIVQGHTPRRGEVGFGLDLEAVQGTVLLRRGENPSRVLDQIHARVAELNNGLLPEGMRIEATYDRSNLIKSTLDTVHHNLLHGFLLIVAVIWLFVRSIAGSLIVATIIPLSLLSAFIGLHAMGLPANLISLGAIDFGILVDGAVVVVENTLHKLQSHPPETRRELIKQVVKSTIDVARPTFYAMAIIIAALIPVFTLERVEGRIFRPLALTYSFALAGALVFALTVIPALCAVFLRVQKKKKKTKPAPPDAQATDATAEPAGPISHAPRFVVAMREGYRWVLRLFLRRVVAAPLVAGALLATTLGFGAQLGTEFLPELDEGDITLFTEMPPSISRARAQHLLLDVRTAVLDFPEVRAATTNHGRPEDGTNNEGVNMAETHVRLGPRDTWRPGVTKQALIEAMRERLLRIPGIRFNFSQPIKDNIEEAIAGVRGKVVLKVFGTDLERMRDTLLAAKDAIDPIAGVTDLDLYRDAAVPQLQIRLDRKALAREGIAIEVAQQTIETALGGTVVTDLWEGERPVPVRVRHVARDRSDVASIRALEVPTAHGAQIPLDELASIGVEMGRAMINREANSRMAALKFNIEDRDMGSVVAEAMAAVAAAVEVPEGHHLEWGGEFESQERAMARLQVIVPLALLVVLALLYGALGTARGALLILLLVPFGAAGGVVALQLAGIPLSVSAVIGFIALIGQVALAGLLVLAAIDDRLKLGEGRLVAAVEGAADRFRAVLMAGLLAILGLLPMAISTGLGSETQKPFALVIVGGMISTLVVALFVLPIVYAWVAPRTPRAAVAPPEVA